MIARAINRIGERVSSQNVVYDKGLRRHMLAIYNLMAGGIMLTFITGMGLQLIGLPNMLMESAGGSILTMILIFSPLAYIFFMGKEITAGSVAKGRTLYWSFAATMGVSMAFVFEQYTGASIAIAFLSAAISFSGLSLYGYTTKSDLTPFRGFLVMALWGLIGAMVLNLFMSTTLFDMAISAAGVLIFAGLTAVDTQMARQMYRKGAEDMNQRAVIWSALALYLDFINLMMHLLRFVGVKKG